MQENENKFVETYAEDMARVIKDDQEGLVKKIIHEQEQKELEKRNLSPESKQNEQYMLFGALFLLASLGTLLYFILKDEAPAVSLAPEFTPIIFNDTSYFIETSGLTREQMIESVLTEARASKVKEGGVEGIYLTQDKQLLGLRGFMAAIKGSFVPPGEEFLSDNFLMGIVNQDVVRSGAVTEKGRHFFFLLKTRSFSDIFDSMRAWESKMFYDLHAFFNVPINSATSYLSTKNFEDGFVENKNARILYDREGVPVLMYVFADDTSVVIADNTKAVREIMFRLSSSKLKK